jgi:hypothetical protein
MIPIRTLRTKATALAAGGLAALLLAGSAFAASPAPAATPPVAHPDIACAAEWAAVKKDPSVANLIALGDCEIARRDVTLDRLQGAVIAAPFLTSADRTALENEIGATRTGLAGLKTTIDADTTVSALKTDLPKIARDYRVYLLVVPQVHLTRGADAESAASGRLTALAGRLGELITFAQSQGKDVTAAKAALAAMTADITDGQSQIGGLSAKILPLTPADWNGGTAAPILNGARASEKSAHDEFVAARNEAKAVIAALKEPARRRRGASVVTPGNARSARRAGRSPVRCSDAADRSHGAPGRARQGLSAAGRATAAGGAARLPRGLWAR